MRLFFYLLSNITGVLNYTTLAKTFDISDKSVKEYINYFEDVFYRYDRYYGYKDRVRGRGLFDHRYYMPADARQYDFCERHSSPRNYARY